MINMVAKCLIFEWMKKANETEAYANRYRWLLTFDEINVSVGDDSCEQNRMNNNNG